MTYLSHPMADDAPYDGPRGRLVQGASLPGAISSWRWEPRVPYLPPGAVGPAIFLYPTVEQARKREEWGGSGFLVGTRSVANKACVHLYAITNEHVATSCPVIRAYTSRGDVVILDDDHPDRRWTSHPDGDDVSVLYLGPFNEHEYWFVPDWIFLARDDIVPPGPGPGDECFMVGRHVNHDGRQFDRPVVRFGNLAMLPEPIRQRERAFDQESFLVDMRSIAGFSGSPVTVFYERQDWRKEGVWIKHPGHLEQSGVVDKAWLLGVDWGHLSQTEDIIDGAGRHQVKVKSSMAAVVPAWKIKDILDTVEGIVKPREQAEKELAEPNPNDAVLDINAPPSEQSEFERFEELTRKLVQAPDSD